jgi:rhodanese-related sulfurtransferase
MKKHIIMLVTAIAMFATALNASDYAEVSKQEAKALYDNEAALFIDARPAKLYKAGTIMNAINIPSDLPKNKQGMLPINKDLKIVSFCNGPKCHHSEKLAKALTKAGYTNIVIYAGGYPEWKEEGYPQMGLLRECESSSEGAYKPKRDAVTVNGVEVYPGGMPGQVDQKWLAPLINEGKLPQNVQLVDVRKADQYNEGHIKGAQNVTFDADSSKLDESKLASDKLNVFYCNTGLTSGDAYNSLSDEAKKRALYIDATLKCEGDTCTLEPNMDLSELL